ncbi:hypothetical protein SPRG_14815 [Saprolegnia parasitica CBS 223.65]|uniref:F-box domain-containing protein n=1 Tax=Saprolegnia parasitica (strain CBS 223.65) TaxID=695850 RepID=A0A067BL89_SAPPC|nr:hypothetical protein SPRG_14815 [Saprolegnia parasitica CBS 223.65]KDO18978.1 hypothetical protein SPRG_14815 [Saprolegnia parasitica CBS 223.65]|eukprot:XP_012210326.1 hypothetical protein SPRG_14815 [Saprolegnia parasitica CBS 223.65]
MSSSSKRQAAAFSTVLDLDHVLATIANVPLAALHELLQAAQHHVLATEPKPLDALWPRLRLDVITPAATGLVRDAIPVFPAASAGTMDAARPSDLDAVEWLRLWSAKITHYKHVEGVAPFDYPHLCDLCDVLRECTKLIAVDVREASDAEMILEAVTTPAHRVHSISVDCYIFDFDFATLDCWLSPGHAEHLTFSFYAIDDEVNPALVPMLLKTTALSSLELCLSGAGFLAPLVAVAPSFSRLTSLRILTHRDDMPVLVHFLLHLNVTKLCTLSLECDSDDFNSLLPALSTLPALERLELIEGFLNRPSPTAVMLPSTLRCVTFVRMMCTSTMWNLFAASIFQLRILDELAWIKCSVFRPSIATVPISVDAVPDWIHRGGTINDTAAMALATALPRTTSHFGTILTLSGAPLSVHSYLTLGEALASCHGVSIVLPYFDSETFETEAGKRHIRYRYEHTKTLVLESPTTSP